ncbi:MAG: SDR family NAD(P)-dependent oxidoreductase, partial [Dehalococcoidia bacterium]|nr:SDR family NAD(P)-dependent oxidoreductase [Dehalococcoidia bacterium]
MDLSNRVALVTGSSRGLGKAVAILLAQRGAAVVINYSHSQSEADAVASTILEAGGRAVVAGGD